MIDLLSHSFRVGRFFGITVRVHILFVIWAAFRLLQDSNNWEWRAAFMGLLFGIVLLHEFGHCFGARAVGGDAEDILMWPLGGLAFAHAPMRPWPQFVTVACGPLVNLIFCLLSGAVLAYYAGTLRIFSLDPDIMPVAPGPPWLIYVSLFYSVNYWLLAFNLLPIYPMDGGQLLQTILWPFLGLRRSMEIACSLGLVGAVLLGMWGLTGGGGGMLIFIAIFGGFTCWQRLQQLRYGMVVDERIATFDHVGRKQNLRPWWQRIFGVRRRPQATTQNPNPGGWQEQLDDQQRTDDEVDRILKKVHDYGIQSLSYVERQALERATRERQRRDRELERRGQ
jgi:Zn-dependent protease